MSKTLPTVIALVKLCFSKLFNITTDSAPVMVKQNKVLFPPENTDERPWIFPSNQKKSTALSKGSVCEGSATKESNRRDRNNSKSDFSSRTKLL